MIEFDAIVAVDFMCFKYLKLDLKGRGLYFVEGENRDERGYKKSNGSGKSSVVDVLVWGLFGTTLRDLEKDAVIQNGADDCIVKIALRVDGAMYWAHRELSRNGARKISLLDDREVDIGQGTSSATQEKIEKLLGMDKKAFCASVVFGGASTYKFSALSNKERKDVLDEAVGAATYSCAARLAKKEKDEHAMIVATKGVVVDHAREHLEDLRRQLRRAKEMAAAATETSSLSKEEERDLKILRVGVLKLPATQKAYEEASRELERTHEARDAKTRKFNTVSELLEEERSRLRTMLSAKRCPTCGSERFDVEQARARIREKISKLETENIDINLVSVRDAFLKARDVHDQTRVLLSDLNKAQQRLEVLEAKKEASQKASQKKNLEEDVVRLREELRAAKKDLLKAEKDLVAARQEEKIYAFLEKAFSPGLVSAIIEHAVPAMNAKAEELSRQISDGNMSVSFSTAAETKKGKTIDRLDLNVEHERGAKSYDGSSQGERGSADLVAGMAIQSLVSQGAAKCSVAFYDEILDSLDEVAGRRVLEVLREQAKEKKVFLISHAEWIKEEHFDGVVRVTKEGGSSKVAVSA